MTSRRAASARAGAGPGTAPPAGAGSQPRRLQSIPVAAHLEGKSGRGVALAGLTRSAKCPPPPSGCGCPHPLDRDGVRAPCRSSAPDLAAAAPELPLTSPRSGRPRDHGQLGHAPSPAVRAAARLRKLPPRASSPSPRTRSPGLGRTRARRSQKQGSLRISPTSGRSPPTKPRDWGGGSPCRPVGAGLPGTLPPPGTLCRGNRAGRKPGVRRGEGPSLRATAP